MSKIESLLMNVYYWLLYYLGWPDKDGKLKTHGDRDKITFMLRRSRVRLGVWWWVLSLTTILGVWTLVLLVSWWYLILELFLLWLFVHVLYVAHFTQKELGQ